MISGQQDSRISPAQKLLHKIAYGKLDAVIRILDDHPELLLEAGDVRVPSGDVILHATPYELALGAGDDGMAEVIAWYFSQIKDGEKERLRQYAKYEPYFADMGDHSKYDFLRLFKLIKNSSLEDVRAAAKLDGEHDSELQRELQKFRVQFTPGLYQDKMHFKYGDLIDAFNEFFYTLGHSSRNDSEKFDLAWFQVIGYLQRGLPACDRQAFAQGIARIVMGKQKLIRSFDNHEYSSGRHYAGGCFPVTDSDFSMKGLGYQFAATIPDELYFYCSKQPLRENYSEYISNKIRRLLELKNPLPQNAPRPKTLHPRLHQPLNNYACAEELLRLFSVDLPWQDFEMQSQKDERSQLIMAFIKRLDYERNGELFTSSPSIEFLKTAYDAGYRLSFGGVDHVHNDGCGCGLNLQISKDGVTIKNSNILGGLGDLQVSDVWKFLRLELKHKIHDDCDLNMLGKYIINSLSIERAKDNAYAKTHSEDKESHQNFCRTTHYVKRALDLRSINPEKIKMLEGIIQNCLWQAGYHSANFKLKIENMSSSGGKSYRVRGFFYMTDTNEKYLSAFISEKNNERFQQLDFHRVLKEFKAQMKLLPASELELPYVEGEAVKMKSYRGMSKKEFGKLLEEARNDPNPDPKDDFPGMRKR